MCSYIIPTREVDDFGPRWFDRRTYQSSLPCGTHGINAMFCRPGDVSFGFLRHETKGD